jgi:hypothetical protein
MRDAHPAIQCVLCSRRLATMSSGLSIQADAILEYPRVSTRAGSGYRPGGNPNPPARRAPARPANARAITSGMSRSSGVRRA